MQNGVEHRERVEPYARGAEVVPVVVNCPADRLAPGHVAQQGGAQLVPQDGRGARFLASLYEGTDVPVKPTTDFKTASWAKLCNNIGAGPATALTDKGRGVLHEPEVAELCRGLVRECAAVGRAEGAKLADDVAEQTIERLRDADPEATTSMLVDRRAGRPIEADAMTGGGHSHRRQARNPHALERRGACPVEFHQYACHRKSELNFNCLRLIVKAPYDVRLHDEKQEKSGPCAHAKARPGEFHPRKSPHLPSSIGLRTMAEFPCVRIPQRHFSRI